MLQRAWILTWLPSWVRNLIYQYLMAINKWIIFLSLENIGRWILIDAIIQ